MTEFTIQVAWPDGSNETIKQSFEIVPGPAQIINLSNGERAVIEVIDTDARIIRAWALAK